jgi:N-acetylglutamate synthase-like GNAT family acetyltransferase
LDDDLTSVIRPRRKSGKGRGAATARLAFGRKPPLPDGADETQRAHPTRIPDKKPKPAPQPESEPETALQIRTARNADAEALVALLALVGSDASAHSVERDIASAARRKEPILVADKGGAIGCLAWHALPLLGNGPVARITNLVVDEDARRAGVGRALYDAFSQRAAGAGCVSVEAMSEIAVRNANGFFRALGLGQASYRFTREI